MGSTLARNTVGLKNKPLKSDRLHIDLADEKMARHWAKRLNRSKEEIEAAVAKVGNNFETVAKELANNSVLIGRVSPNGA